MRRSRTRDRPIPQRWNGSTGLGTGTGAGSEVRRRTGFVARSIFRAIVTAESTPACSPSVSSRTPSGVRTRALGTAAVSAVTVNQGGGEHLDATVPTGGPVVVAAGHRGLLNRPAPGTAHDGRSGDGTS